MSYGSYGRYGSGYSSHSGGNWRLGSTPIGSYLSNYTPRRPTSGQYGLSPSYSSSYLSPNSSPRNSLTSGSIRDLHPTSSDLSGYRLSTSKSASSLRPYDGSSRPGSAGRADRNRQKYGSSSSIPDTASETSYKSDTSRYGSRGSIEDENSDYKKLYDEVKMENERLKEALLKTEDELGSTKEKFQKVNQTTVITTSPNELEKKERRGLERKLSELEEEVKNISKLKTENENLKAENRALSRVVCKLSK